MKEPRGEKGVAQILCGVWGGWGDGGREGASQESQGSREARRALLPHPPCPSSLAAQQSHSPPERSVVGWMACQCTTEGSFSILPPCSMLSLSSIHP